MATKAGFGINCKIGITDPQTCVTVYDAQILISTKILNLNYNFHINIGELNPLISIYKTTNENIEIWARTTKHVLMKAVLPCNIFPTMIISYYKYYKDDLMAESFHLPFPSMYGF